jgi:hypothetical protein
MSTETQYSTDFYQWTTDQAQLLMSGDLDSLDIEHIIEELQALGRSEKREIYSRLIVLLTHLLKCRYQPEQVCNSWKASIAGAKFEINRLLEQNPSLNNCLSDMLDDAYVSASLRAVEETNIDSDIFPKECPWKIEKLFKE